MTKAEALAKARERFGEKASVEIDMPHFSPRLRYVHPSGSFSTFTSGQGRNWDAALNQAIWKEMKSLGIWS
jgi:hypothetical protein